MTPTVAQLLQGVIVGLSTPLPPEAGGAYAASRMGMLAALTGLAIQESEKGVDVRLAENAAIRDMLAKAGDRYPDAAPAPQSPDLTISALDAANADLRRRLTALHTAVEQAKDAPLDREILLLYRRMAQLRRLQMGG
jgi:hypothetical protein